MAKTLFKYKAPIVHESMQSGSWSPALPDYDNIRGGEMFCDHLLESQEFTSQPAIQSLH